MNISEYFTIVREKLNHSEIIKSINIVDERIFLGKGYFRARLILSNGDFLEIAESLVEQSQQLITLDYRYQWMDVTKQTLRKRWDSVKHFPDLDNFPHHVHILQESNVEP